MMCSQPLFWIAHAKSAVPCGKCLPCLSNKRNEWAFRLEQEWKASKSAFFITLTYDRKNLEKANYELSKRDLQLFFKRLRKNDATARVRYYAVGEYGSKMLRPHYHILLFNALEQHVRKAWTKGIVHVGYVSAASVKYTLKYIVQPDLLPSGKSKPFTLMSRGYGLGLNYLTDEMLSWHRSGDRNYAQVYGVPHRLPRYYRDKIWYRQADKERVSNASKWLAIKKSRKELRFYVNRYGAQKAKKKMAEMRNAVIQRIKTKVAFTQTL